MDSARPLRTVVYPNLARPCMKRTLLSLTLAASCLTPAALFGQSTMLGVRRMFGQPGAVFSEDSAKSRKQIFYHGGPIMLGVNRLYIIYYGQFTHGQSDTPTIINDFFSNIGGSGNYNVN